MNQAHLESSFHTTHHALRKTKRIHAFDSFSISPPPKSSTPPLSKLVTEKRIVHPNSEPPLDMIKRPVRRDGSSPEPSGPPPKILSPTELEAIKLRQHILQCCSITRSLNSV